MTDLSYKLIVNNQTGAAKLQDLASVRTAFDLRHQAGLVDAQAIEDLHDHSMHAFVNGSISATEYVETIHKIGAADISNMRDAERDVFTKTRAQIKKENADLIAEAKLKMMAEDPATATGVEVSETIMAIYDLAKRKKAGAAEKVLVMLENYESLKPVDPGAKKLHQQHIAHNAPYIRAQVSIQPN